MESHIVDGNNIGSFNLLSELKASMKENPRPVLLEFKPPMQGHEEASGTKYVPQLMDMWAEKKIL
jgi:2-oxoisovalerate dehydrogenase E1 component